MANLKKRIALNPNLKPLASMMGGLIVLTPASKCPSQSSASVDRVPRKRFMFITHAFAASYKAFQILVNFILAWNCSVFGTFLHFSLLI